MPDIWLSPITPVETLSLTYVDVETTGLAPGHGDRVCEIALLRMQGEQEVARFESLVHPQCLMPPEVTAVHGLTDAMLADAPPFADLIPTLQALLKDSIIVGHNVRFDLNFLYHEWCAAGQTLPDFAVIDTLALAQAYYDFRHNSLGAIATTLGISHTPRHRAMADVLATRDVLHHFVADLRQRAPVTLAQLMYPSKRRSSADMAAMMTTLEEALTDRTPLHLRYRGWKAPETVRVVQPLAVYYERGYGFLRAFCHLRRDERSFRFDRITELKVLAQE
jgi:DNA polymerase-3 subunit epsilon